MQDEPENESLRLILFVNLIIMAAVHISIPLSEKERNGHHEDSKEGVHSRPF
jgi:hypothetical protein